MKLIVIQPSQSRSSHSDVEVTSFYLYAHEIAKIQQSNKFISGGRGNHDPPAVSDHGIITLWSPISPSQMHMQPFTLFTPFFVDSPDCGLQVSPSCSFNLKSTIYSCCQRPKPFPVSLSCRTSQISPKQQKHRLSCCFLEEPIIS